MIDRAVRMNYHTNLLELEEHMYPLVDVEKPNVFRNLFPYTEVPKIAFNDRIVPTICRTISGSQIQLSVTDSSPEPLQYRTDRKDL